MNTVIENPIVDYYEQVKAQAARFAETAAHAAADDFHPFALPEIDETVRAFFAASSVSVHKLDLGIGLDVVLLNMGRFERTRTTKTNPSLLMVARAIEHTRRTGEAVTIVTPSSGNKATALRAAVERAYDFSLASPATLNIVCVVPQAASSKLWNSAMSTDADLRESNPLVTVRTDARDTVKRLVVAARGLLPGSISGRRLWFTLALDNYVLADQLRAFVELDYFPTKATRWHAHSVSSAYGLIGHSRGWNYAAPTDYPHPGYLLVQHLDTPDMVLHLTRATFDRARIPDYRPSEKGGVEQSDSIHFPSRASSSFECIDTTFYTTAPPTQDEMQAYIAAYGGNGIVVSKSECEAQYAETRSSLAHAAVSLPEQSSELREWSLLMAATGVYQAFDKGMLNGVDSIMLHNGGSYTDSDYEPVPSNFLTNLAGDRADDLSSIIENTSKEMARP